MPARLPFSVAAAAVVAVASGALWFLGTRSNPLPASSVAGVGNKTARLDLQHYSAVSGDQKNPPQESLSLPRGRVEITILLPVGSEPGSYELHVLDSDRLHSRTSVTGAARLEDHVTTLRATADLALLAPGPYHLAIRRQDQHWRLFPLRIVE